MYVCAHACGSLPRHSGTATSALRAGPLRSISALRWREALALAARRLREPSRSSIRAPPVRPTVRDARPACGPFPCPLPGGSSRRPRSARPRSAPTSPCGPQAPRSARRAHWALPSTQRQQKHRTRTWRGRGRGLRTRRSGRAAAGSPLRRAPPALAWRAGAPGSQPCALARGFGCLGLCHARPAAAESGGFLGPAGERREVLMRI